MLSLLLLLSMLDVTISALQALPDDFSLSADTRAGSFAISSSSHQETIVSYKASPELTGFRSIRHSR